MSLLFKVRIYLHIFREPVLASVEVPFDQAWEAGSITVQNPAHSSIDDLAVDVDLRH
jgi:hypothetical protein